MQEEAVYGRSNCAIGYGITDDRTTGWSDAPSTRVGADDQRAHRLPFAWQAPGVGISAVRRPERTRKDLAHELG